MPTDDEWKAFHELVQVMIVDSRTIKFLHDRLDKTKNPSLEYFALRSYYESFKRKHQQNLDASESFIRRISE
jgi:hypothetical protein